MPLPLAGVAAFKRQAVAPALVVACSLIVVGPVKVISAVSAMPSVCPLTLA